MLLQVLFPRGWSGSLGVPVIAHAERDLGFEFDNATPEMTHTAVARCRTHKCVTYTNVQVNYEEIFKPIIQLLPSVFVRANLFTTYSLDLVILIVV